MAGEFGDAFIQDTELEGGHVAPTVSIPALPPAIGSR
jgi:hypothetical protein